MKIVLLVLAVITCACVARPDGEEHANDNKRIMVDLDKLTTELRKGFADEKFLEEKLGQPHRCDTSAGGSTLAIADGNVNLLKGSWVNKIPWGTIIDVIVEIVKKTTE